jgi:hypothetical protein
MTKLFLQFVAKWASKTRTRKIIFCSILVPGLGHNDLGYRKEGAILACIALAVVASGAAIHSIFFFVAPAFWLVQCADAVRLARTQERTMANAKMESEKTWWD